jgi:hypothetical protein
MRLAAPTQCDLILEELTKAAGDWVSMPYLAHRSGSYNVHTRIDQLRHERGLAIENKCDPDPDQPRRRLSYYRLIP